MSFNASWLMDIKDKAQEAIGAAFFKVGVYRHYKGSLYVAFAITLNELTLEPMVHYYSRDKQTRWTRTWKNFTSGVRAPNGGLMSRFEYLGPSEFSELTVAAGWGVK
jgi:hypothetical protein